MQDLESVGVGARNLKECLMIQVKIKGMFDKNIEKIILDYLEYIADNKYIYISKKLNISPKEVQEYADVIRKLEPKPSRGYYTGEDVKFIIPDAYVIKINNEYSVVMNNAVIPKITINDLYRKTILNSKKSDEVYYIKEKVNEAKNLINDIEQKSSTVLKLLKCIVEKQREYFEKGKEFLKLMLLKDIAKEIGMNESTVSRAIKDKYILTLRGTVKIKDLFCNGVMTSGEDISINNIKSKIKKLIDLENKSKPLSDQIICNVLIEEQIDISRRTVAKYREEIGIKSSFKRKRI